jgi:hypothetical protein
VPVENDSLRRALSELLLEENADACGKKMELGGLWANAQGCPDGKDKYFIINK